MKKFSDIFGVFLRLRLGIVATALSAGCAHSTAELVKNADLQKTIVSSPTYQHVVFRPAEVLGGERLNVYIGGDGRPWSRGRYPSADPTPAKALALELMTLDHTDSVFIGRPCYFGLADDPNCTATDWTFARFSEQIVASMAFTIRQLIIDGGYSRVVLIGYSGGGTLARLIASDIPNITGLLTIAGNLDITAWTESHGYLPLHDSLNPASQTQLSSRILHVQVIGLLDTVVPLSVTSGYQASGNELQIWTYPDFDHVCCWAREWPSILTRFEETMTNHAQ